jgi:hypothetical protein
MLLREGTARQNQLGEAINNMSSAGLGYLDEEFSSVVVQMQAMQGSQSGLIDSAKQYVLGLDSIGQNQAFQKIAAQMGVATDQVRQFFGELAKGQSPVGETLKTVADFEGEISRLKEAQKDVSDPATYQKLGKQIAENERKIARITGKSTGAGTGAGARAGAGATSSTLTSRSPQTFNINITKLVETINTTKPQLNTTDSQTMRQITEALVMAVNDVQTTVQ